jgi:tetratricopeptide (TPR) repeat protein
MHRFYRFYYCLFIFIILTSGCSVLTVSEGRRDFNTAAALFREGDCEKASLKFSEALNKDPELREGYVYLAECSLKKGDYMTALLQAEQAAATAAGDAGIRARLKTIFLAGGRSALDSRNYDAAIRFFRDGAALDQKDGIFRLWLGKALLERGNKGDMKAALAEFKTVMSTSASPAQDLALVRSALFSRAEKYSAQGDMYTQSRCYLAYTENFNKDDAEAFINLGKLFSRMGNPVGALYYARKAYSLDPKNKAAIELMNDLNNPIHP